MDVNKAFEVINGVLVNENSAGNVIEGPFYTGGPNSPVGLNLPEKTVYVQNKIDGMLIWRKFGNGVNDWCIHDGLYRHDEHASIFVIPANNTYVAYQMKVGVKLNLHGRLRCK